MTFLAATFARAFRDADSSEVENLLAQSADATGTVPGTVDGLSLSPSILEGMEPAFSQVSSSATRKEIIELLRASGRQAVAGRLAYLQGLHRDDPDEPRLGLDSLRTLANFLLRNRRFPAPRVGLTPDGLAACEWRIPPDGIIAFECHADHWIRFAAIKGTLQSGSRRGRISGTLPEREFVSTIQKIAHPLWSRG